MHDAMQPQTGAPAAPADYCISPQLETDPSRGLFRTRKPNWTEPETMLLVSLVDKHCILRSRLMDYNTNQQKTEIWCTITTLINQRNPSVLRTVDEVKRRWQNVYSIAKREAGEFHLAMKNKPSSTPVPQLHQFLCPISIRIVDIFGGIDSFGLNDNCGTQQHAAPPSNSSFEVSSSERSSIDSSPATPRLNQVTMPELAKGIKREAGIGDAPDNAWGPYDRRDDRRATLTQVDTCLHTVPDLSAAPCVKQQRLGTAQVATQTEPAEEGVRMDMLRMERDLLHLRVERARVRLERDRMRLLMERSARELKLERLKRQEPT